MKPRRYETLIMLAPDLGVEFVEKFKTRVDDIIESAKGKILRYEDWGRKRLSYPIKKEMFANYVLYEFQGTKELSAEFDRILKLDETVFKFLTLVIDKEFTDEKFTAAFDLLNQETGQKTYDDDESETKSEDDNDSEDGDSKDDSDDGDEKDNG